MKLSIEGLTNEFHFFFSIYKENNTKIPTKNSPISKIHENSRNKCVENVAKFIQQIFRCNFCYIRIRGGYGGRFYSPSDAFPYSMHTKYTNHPSFHIIFIYYIVIATNKSII